MNFEYILLPIGIALLVVPTALICGSKMRERLDQPARRRNEGLSSLFRSGINWIDLVRGGAGAWMVQKPFQDTISSQDELATTFLVVQGAVLFVGILAQTLWLRRPARVIGPVFFMTGLTLAVSGPLIGGFALVIGISCALIFGRLSLVFGLVPMALVAFGLLFHDFSVLNAVNAAAFALPVFLAFTYGTRISFVRCTVKIGGRIPDAARLRQPESAPEAQPETASELGTVIRPDFAHPAALTPVSTPDPEVAHVSGDAIPLPDFLRIAEEPERPRRRSRHRLFARRRA